VQSVTPSNICLKLRMHLRTRRLVDVRQLGADRIVVFTFGAQRMRFFRAQRRCGTRHTR
jgi:predicted ribosome quality control (RQC) complex YloA/Tae2 family protein